MVLAGHALLVPSVSSRREQALAERVDVLTRTRKDALDVQVAEMRRVERDLHDGAQARLVSLGMSLGMADELLDSDPDEARRLLAEARTAAGDALGDLRALVRGILPPVLADRGLAGAVQALVLASPVPVEMTVELPAERLPAPGRVGGVLRRRRGDHQRDQAQRGASPPGYGCAKRTACSRWWSGTTAEAAPIPTKGAVCGESNADWRPSTARCRSRAHPVGRRS